VLLHASNAITFDLEAIRRANRGFGLRRFCAVAANAEAGAPEATEPSADLWVLVDGQMRFGRRQLTSSKGLFPVVVPLDRKDRFLTLAATDGGNTIHLDWIIFGDPRLELSPVESQ
jgi:hypothetical protein